MDILIMILGFLIGTLISSLWSYYFDGYFSLIYNFSHYLRVLEHYHHGLFLVILSCILPDPLKSLLFGLGIQLIIDERYQNNPFALGKEYFEYSTIIGIFLVAILFLSLKYLI